MSLVFAALLLAAPLGLPSPPPAALPPPTGCHGPDYAAFEFWVGDWDVFAGGSDRRVAQSRIEKIYAGCAIRENWMPSRGSDGGSLSGYDPASGLWTQTWIGSAPGPVQFSGGAAGGGASDRTGAAMVLTGFWRNVSGPGNHAWIRMTYTATGPDEVRQLGEQSTDNGLSWQPSFDFVYRRRVAP